MASSLTLNNNSLVYVNEVGVSTTIDLGKYIDLSGNQVVNATLQNNNKTLILTRPDNTIITVDFASLLDTMGITQVVTSFNGKSGDVTLDMTKLSCIIAGCIDFTKDMDKPVSSAVGACLNKMQSAVDSVPDLSRSRSYPTINGVVVSTDAFSYDNGVYKGVGTAPGGIPLAALSSYDSAVSNTKYIQVNPICGLTITNSRCENGNKPTLVFNGNFLLNGTYITGSGGAGSGGGTTAGLKCVSVDVNNVITFTEATGSVSRYSPFTDICYTSPIFYDQAANRLSFCTRVDHKDSNGYIVPEKHDCYISIPTIFGNTSIKTLQDVSDYTSVCDGMVMTYDSQTCTWMPKVIPTLPSNGDTVNWGGILGCIDNQTDLFNKLKPISSIPKINDSNLFGRVAVYDHSICGLCLAPSLRVGVHCTGTGGSLLNSAITDVVCGNNMVSSPTFCIPNKGILTPQVITGLDYNPATKKLMYTDELCTTTTIDLSGIATGGKINICDISADVSGNLKITKDDSSNYILNMDKYNNDNSKALSKLTDDVMICSPVNDQVLYYVNCKWCNISIDSAISRASNICVPWKNIIGGTVSDNAVLKECLNKFTSFSPSAIINKAEASGAIAVVSYNNAAGTYTLTNSNSKATLSSDGIEFTGFCVSKNTTVNNIVSGSTFCCSNNTLTIKQLNGFCDSIIINPKIDLSSLHDVQTCNITNGSVLTYCNAQWVPAKVVTQSDLDGAIASSKSYCCVYTDRVDVIVIHNLAKYPQVSVLDQLGNCVLTNVVQQGLNCFSVHFNNNSSGTIVYS